MPRASRPIALAPILAAIAVTAVTMARGADLPPTPAQPKGPFYPIAFPKESDTDLATYEGLKAQGSVMIVAGRVRGRDGRPVAGARVEIWQTNTHGRYHHENDDSPAPPDPGFQGWGQTTTGPDGAYRFRTVRPAAYTGRTPHIHFAVTAPGRRSFYTQLYFAGEAENRRDSILGHLTDAQRAQLLVSLPAGAEPEARFDIVLP